jgi:hypothetical protein
VGRVGGGGGGGGFGGGSLATMSAESSFFDSRPCDQAPTSLTESGRVSKMSSDVDTIGRRIVGWYVGACAMRWWGAMAAPRPRSIA